MNAVTSHEIEVEREEGAKVDCHNESAVDRPAYIAPPTIVDSATVTEPETLEESKSVGHWRPSRYLLCGVGALNVVGC